MAEQPKAEQRKTTVDQPLSSRFEIVQGDPDYRKTVDGFFTSKIKSLKEEGDTETGKEQAKAGLFKTALRELAESQFAVKQAVKQPEQIAEALAYVFGETHQGANEVFKKSFEKLQPDAQVPQFSDVTKGLKALSKKESAFARQATTLADVMAKTQSPRGLEQLRIVDDLLNNAGESLKRNTMSPDNEPLSTEDKAVLFDLLSTLHKLRLYRDALKNEVDKQSKSTKREEKLTQARATLEQGPKRPAAKPEAKKESSVEQQEQALLREINKDGSAKVSISIKPDMLRTGSEPRKPGINFFSDEKRTEKRDTLGFPGHFQKGFDKNGVNEIVMLRSETEPTYREVRTEKPKWLGLSSTTEIKQEHTGNRARLHSELVQNGKAEPAYRLTYQVRSDRQARGIWRDYSGREGQTLLVEIVLPESVAKTVLARIKQDPTFIRRIAENQALGKTPISQQAWEGKIPARANDKIYETGHYDPLRPPYERWAQNGQPMKIYIGEDEDDFDPTKVRTL